METKAQKIWGVVDNQDIIHDVSNSEKGAKRYATLNGYDKIGYRPNGNYYGIITHEKVNNIWKPYNA